MIERKYSKGMAVVFFIQHKIFEIGLVVLGVIGVYYLGFIEKWLTLKYFSKSMVLCKGYFSCFMAGFFVLLGILGILLTIAIILLFLAGIIFPLFNYNWEKAKRRASLK